MAIEALYDFAAFQIHRQAQEILKDARRPTFDMPSELVDHEFVEVSDWTLTMVYKLNGRTLLYGASAREGKNRGY